MQNIISFIVYYFLYFVNVLMFIFKATHDGRLG